MPLGILVAGASYISETTSTERNGIGNEL
jgi:hypothetical protein